MVEALLADEVVPALKRSVGAQLILPSGVTLTPTSFADGHVNVDYNPNTGELVSVREPIICSTENRVRLKYVLVHELAHYHELTMRKRLGIRVKGHATSLWSEYYAQRICWMSRAALPPMEALSGGEGVVEREGEADNPDYLWAYMITFVLAHASVVPDWRSAYPGKDSHLSIFVDSCGSRLRDRFRGFPRWHESDSIVVEATFGTLLKSRARDRPA